MIVSVLIPTLNRPEYLRQCLQSLLSQRRAPDQVLVVDDGSTDPSVAQVLQEFSAAVESFSTTGLGRGGAINLAAARARGQLLWVFDDDDIALPDALERLLAPFLHAPDLGFSYGSHRRGLGLRDPVAEVPGEDQLWQGLLLGNLLPGGSMLIRASLFQQVGGFDAALLRSQDYDLALRLARTARCRRAPGGPLFLQRQHDGVRGGPGQRFPAQQRNAYWLSYDQRIFRRLYQELKLAEYGAEERSALLQRMVAMAGKLLIPEVIGDLQELGRLPYRPWNDAEQRLWLMLHNQPYYNLGHVLDEPEVWRALLQFGLAARVRRSGWLWWCRRPGLARLRQLLGRLWLSYTVATPGRNASDPWL